MVRLAVARNPRFTVSTVEIARPGVSYSIDTIRQFAGKQQGRFALLHNRLGCVSRDRYMEGFQRSFPSVILSSPRGRSKESHPLRGTGIAVKKLFCYDFKRKITPSEWHVAAFFEAHRHRHFGLGDSRARTEGKSIRYLVPS